MKLKQYLKTTLLFTVLLLFVSACQKEHFEIVEPDNETVITAKDTIADLLLKVALKDGSFDNIVDRCSEISIQFPYTVKIRNEVFEITSQADVEALKLEYLESAKSINISFPVTVVFSDYSESVLSNQGNLNKIQNQFNTKLEDDDIECTDIVYPVTMAIFNSKYQKNDLVTVYNDKALHKIFSEINDLIVEMKYPILVKSKDGGTTYIHNNAELKNKIESDSTMGYDEDDETDFGD